MLSEIEKTMLYSKQLVYFNRTTLEQRVHNSNTTNDITDLNINKTIKKFQNQLKNEFCLQSSLRYFTDIEKINFSLKTNCRTKYHHENDMKELFESKKKVTTIGASDSKTIFARVSFLQYEQVFLDKNFRQYLQTFMMSKKSYGWVFKKHQFRKHMKCWLVLIQL